MRKALANYAFAAGVGLAASTIYFLLTPIDDAHAEILSRTLPTVYDVLIALFGGFAGIIAISSKYKGNVSKLKYYDLEDVTVEIRQGFAFLQEIRQDNKYDEQINQLGLALQKNEEARAALKMQLDSISNQQKLAGVQIYNELKVQYPQLAEAIIQPVTINSDSLPELYPAYLVLLHIPEGLKKDEEKKVESWLKVRLMNSQITLIVQPGQEPLRGK